MTENLPAWLFLASITASIVGFWVIWKGWWVYKHELYAISSPFQLTYTGRLAKRYGTFYVTLGALFVIVAIFCLYFSLQQKGQIYG